MSSQDEVVHVPKVVSDFTQFPRFRSHSVLSRVSAGSYDYGHKACAAYRKTGGVWLSPCSSLSTHTSVSHPLEEV